MTYKKIFVSLYVKQHMSLPITVLDIWQHSVYWIISKYLYYLERNSKMIKNLIFIYESKISNFDYFWKKYIIFKNLEISFPMKFDRVSFSLSWSFTSVSIIFRLKIFYLLSRFLRSCTESCQFYYWAKWRIVVYAQNVHLFSIVFVFLP